MGDDLLTSRTAGEMRRAIVGVVVGGWRHWAGVISNERSTFKEKCRDF
jgi:hypothetical protein